MIKNRHDFFKFLQTSQINNVFSKIKNQKYGFFTDWNKSGLSKDHKLIRFLQRSKTNMISSEIKNNYIFYKDKKNCCIQRLETDMASPKIKDKYGFSMIDK